jgi:hypothetical protein
MASSRCILGALGPESVDRMFAQYPNITESIKDHTSRLTLSSERIPDFEAQRLSVVETKFRTGRSQEFSPRVSMNLHSSTSRRGSQSVLDTMEYRPSLNRRVSHSFLEGMAEFRTSQHSLGSRAILNNSASTQEESSGGSEYFAFGAAKTASTMSLSLLEDEENTDEYEIDSPASKSMGHASAFSTLMKHVGKLLV